MVDNPYTGRLAEAWDKGKAEARKRHGSRSANPYFDAGMKEAWNQGFDEQKSSKRKTRFL